jgi:hypothetical protein
MSEKETYSLFISSTDKISGTNNNGQYNINWDDFLPRGYNFFKMIFNFQTGGGYYKDFTGATTTQATAAATTVTTSVSTTASTSVILSASNSNIVVGMAITNGSIVGNCYVAAIVGNVLTLSSSQTIAAGQTLTFNSTISTTSITLSAVNNNIVVGQSVSNASIVGACFVAAISGTALTLSSSQIINGGQTLTFTPINVFAAGKIVFNTVGKSNSFDTKTMSQSNTIGYIQRDIQTSSNSSNTLGCFFSFNAPKTISRPNQNIVTISIYNTCYTTATNSLLVDTNSAGTALSTDMSNWNMIIEFIPIEDSAQPNHVNF